MKKLVRSSIVVFLVFCSAGAGASDALTGEKREDVKKLLEATGALKVGQLMSEALVLQFTEALKKVRPDIPEKALTIMADEVNKTIADELKAKNGFIDLMVVLYHKHFTHTEIKGLLAFYQTPLGKKAGSLAPTMSQEGMAIGQQWGQSLGPTVVERVRTRLGKEGFEI